MDELLFTLFWVFGWVLLLILIWHLKGQRRQKRLEMVHQERMLTLEKGIPLPDLPDFAEPPSSYLLADLAATIRINPRGPLGLGAIFVLVGVVVSLALWLSQLPAASSVAVRARRCLLRARLVRPLPADPPKGPLSPPRGTASGADVPALRREAA